MEGYNSIKTRMYSFSSVSLPPKKPFETSRRGLQYVPTYKNTCSLLKKNQIMNNNKIKHMFLPSTKIFGLLRCTSGFLFIAVASDNDDREEAFTQHVELLS